MEKLYTTEWVSLINHDSFIDLESYAIYYIQDEFIYKNIIPDKCVWVRQGAHPRVEYLKGSFITLALGRQH